MPTSHDHHHRPAPAGDHHGHRAAQHAHDDGQAQVLDLDAEVLSEHITAVAAWLPVRTPPTEIVDLGAGTGAGSFALLRQFPGIHLTAVDASAAHLEQLRATADAVGLSDRVDTVQADLDASDWPDLGAPDLVWASASLHHLADPDQALRRIRDDLAPGGLVAVVELAGLPRFLPATAPEDSPGLEERCHAALQQRQAEHMPHRGADWGPKLTAAGFTLVEKLVLDVEVKGADHDAVGRYALAVLQGLRRAASDALPADDLTALDRLIDTAGSHSILHRQDLVARTTRIVWAARPASDNATVTTTAAPEPAEADGPNEWFSAAAEAANCERVLGNRRHGLDTLLVDERGATTNLLT